MAVLQTVETVQVDAEAVAAVRQGDRERYGELVRRHERRVFAIAWSRLGDRDMAEEATQEAFIKGYHRLWLLHDGARFAGWIATIARHVAINLGVRHRRELRRRERWALESDSSIAPSPAETEDPPRAETLRATLDALPSTHRECLILFYVEGKSGAEAAASLGISESAFRVRLHRSRAVLRRQLEETLSTSLENLRPSAQVLPAVMAAVLASTTAQAATGATVAGAIGKVIPFSWLMPYLVWFSMLPAFLLGWFFTRWEARNFRDQTGVRARLYRQLVNTRLLWLIPVIALAAWLTSQASLLYGLRGLYLALSLVTFYSALVTARILVINRNPYFVMTVLSSVVLTVVQLAVGLWLLPLSAIHAALAIHMLLFARVFAHRPVRMDYSLFLRAAEGLLLDSPRPGEPADKARILAFARFLGTRWLAANFQWMRGDLVLSLPPIKGWRWEMFAPWRPLLENSHIILSRSGQVVAHLSKKDLQALAWLRSLPVLDARDLEARVRTSVTSSWASFRAGEPAAAEKLLGQLADHDVFKVAPARSKLTRWYQRITVSAALLFVLLLLLVNFKAPWMDGLKPVSLNETELRQALAGFATSTSLSNGLAYAISTCFLLPPPEMFTPDSLLAARRVVLLDWCGLSSDSSLEAKLSALPQSWLLSKLIESRWVGLEDLGVSLSALQRSLQEREPKPWNFLLARRQCRGDDGDYVLEAFDTRTLAQLKWMHAAGVDLPNRESLIQQIVALQVLSGKASGARPPLRNWRDLRGLFLTLGFPALQDTYCQLAALEILGGLDRIDRKACIQRILKLHRGAGFFAPPDTDEKWRLNIRGDARDTWAAFESLRILGALDRVKDLDQWKFRPLHRSDPATTPRPITWEEIEAWLCQQNLHTPVAAAPPHHNPKSP